MIALDASPLLAFLMRERGHQKVREVLGESCMSTVNFSEVLGCGSLNFRERGKVLVVECVNSVQAVDLHSSAYTRTFASMIPGSTGIVVNVPPVKRARAAQVPERQFGLGKGGLRDTAEAGICLQQPQGGVLYQALRIDTGARSQPRQLHFLLAGEMHFHD